MTASARVCARGNIGIHIGAGTYVAFDAVIFSRDGARGLYADTWIGRRCFIGARSIVLPGVRIGDKCVVGAGERCHQRRAGTIRGCRQSRTNHKNDIELDELGIIRVKNYADQGDKSISRRRSASRAPVR